VAVGVFPAALIAFALYAARDERVLGLPALVFAAIVGVAGALAYPLTKLLAPALPSSE